MRTCCECGKPIDEHKVWFWKHNYDKIEVYCYKCGRSHIDEHGDFGLMTNAAFHPDVCDGNRGTQDE